jgi:aminomethyltransferase
MSSGTLKKTPFHDMHVALKGKMVPFAGYTMPVQYPTGITAEHTAVRTNVGLFDVSHMGEFEITGPDRNAFVNRITCNDFGMLTDGQAQYTALLNDRGTFIDDCIAYRFDDKVMLVVNAANLDKDWEHVVGRKGQANIRIKNISDDVALLAVQGPKSEALLQTLTSTDLTTIRYYHFAVGEVSGAQCFIARTGYTGEDGFELYFRAKDAATVWAALATPDGAVPCGLGARDSLRLEVGYPLYGNDIDDTTSPYEARLGWIVKLKKGVPFVGHSALESLKQIGVTRKLVGFTCEGRGAIPRPGYSVFLQGVQVDTVRSGGFSPTLGHGIGTTLLPTHSAEPGTEIEIDARGRRMAGTVTTLPFYKDGSVKRS